MSIMKILLIATIVATIVYIILLVTNKDRFFNMPSTDVLISAYSNKPSIRNKRVVIVLNCERGICEETIKSLLDQSVKVSDIAVETSRPEFIKDNIKKVISIHKPGTTKLRETESDTIVLFLNDGKIYDYDFVEKNVSKILE
jgi:hypothetical protein